MQAAICEGVAGIEVAGEVGQNYMCAHKAGNKRLQQPLVSLRVALTPSLCCTGTVSFLVLIL